nr:MAG TPA: hypothetical protein [Caudoviricetes sp.]
MNGTFDPTYSSNQIWIDTNINECLTTRLDNVNGDISSLQTGKADVSHTHEGYSLVGHTHSEYAPINHSHSGYAVIADSNEFNGEQKFTNSEYCGSLSDTADGVGCAFKASRALINEVLVDKLIITSTTGQMPIYTYSGTSDGAMSGLVKIGYIDTNGNAVFNGAISATNIKDSVVEQGTVGNMRYQKWSSGKSEAWYYESLGELSLTTGMAGGVYSSTACNGRVVNFPSGLFVSKPLAVSNVYSDGYTFSQVAGADSTRLIYRIWSPYSITISGTEIVIHIIGRWK